jgi:polysaccharide pyruvyl transferase WcaK-like protein
MESTTSELITGLRAASVRKKMTVSQDTIANLERVLKQADLVKFAKSKPLDFEITEDRNIQKAITLDSSIPVEIEIEEDALLNEVQKQKQIQIQLKKKRSKRIFIAVAAVLFLLLATTSFVDQDLIM